MNKFTIDRQTYQDSFIEKVLEPLGYYSPDGDETAVLDNPDVIIRPYYWGDCTCGWCDLEMDFSEDHREDCYRSLLDKIAVNYSDKYFNKEYARRRTDLCLKMGLDPDYGCEAHCTCDFDSRHEAYFENNKLGEAGHRDDCPVILPNFELPALGLKIWWYKHPLRGAKSNMPLDDALFDRILCRMYGAGCTCYPD